MLPTPPGNPGEDVHVTPPLLVATTTPVVVVPDTSSREAMQAVAPVHVNGPVMALPGMVVARLQVVPPLVVDSSVLVPELVTPVVHMKGEAPPWVEHEIDVAAVTVEGTVCNAHVEPLPARTTPPGTPLTVPVPTAKHWVALEHADAFNDTTVVVPVVGITLVAVVPSVLRRTPDPPAVPVTTHDEPEAAQVTLVRSVAFTPEGRAIGVTIPVVALTPRRIPTEPPPPPGPKPVSTHWVAVRHDAPEIPETPAGRDSADHEPLSSSRTNAPPLSRPVAKQIPAAGHHTPLARLVWDAYPIWIAPPSS